MKGECGNCLYYASLDKDLRIRNRPDGEVDKGECRRYPPRIVYAMIPNVMRHHCGHTAEGGGSFDEDADEAEDGQMGVFPIVLSYAWCGEWKTDGRPEEIE